MKINRLNFAVTIILIPSLVANIFSSNPSTLRISFNLVLLFLNALFSFENEKELKKEKKK